MKKTLLVLVALLCILTLAACGAMVAQNTNFDEIFGDHAAFYRTARENYDLLANGEEEVTENTSAPAASEPTSYQLGDVNKDGKITNLDILKLFKYIYNPELYPLEGAPVVPEDTTEAPTEEEATEEPDEPEYTEGLEFTAINGGMEYSVSGYTGIDATVVIPATYNGMPVTAIDYMAFYTNDVIESVIIPNSVTSVGDWAFYCCSNLTSVTIPNSITTMGEVVFEECTALKSIYFEGSVDDWIKMPFGGNTSNPMFFATELYINGKLLRSATVGGEIRAYAFYNCTSLEYVHLKSVNSIGSYAFRELTSLKHIICDVTDLTAFRDSESIDVFDDDTIIYSYRRSCDGINCSDGDCENKVLAVATDIWTDQHPWGTYSALHNISQYFDFEFSNDFVFLSSETDSLVMSYIGDDEKMEIPAVTPSGKTVTGLFLLSANPYTSISLPDTVVWIRYTERDFGPAEDIAFDCGTLNEFNNAYYLGNDNNPYLILVKAKSTDITSCAIHGKTKIIASSAFKDCASLTTVQIPNGVIRIDDGAFSGCTSLESITLGSSVNFIGYKSFADCSKLTSIVMPNSIKTIGKGSFYGCSNVTITYKGTTTEWNAINKKSGNYISDIWDEGCSSYTVSCTDGNITK